MPYVNITAEELDSILEGRVKGLHMILDDYIAAPNDEAVRNRFHSELVEAVHLVTRLEEEGRVVEGTPEAVEQPEADVTQEELQEEMDF